MSENGHKVDIKIDMAEQNTIGSASEIVKRIYMTPIHFSMNL